MNTFQTTSGKKFQVVLRKRDSRNGIVRKEFFETEEAANRFVDEHEDKYLCEFIDLAYFKAI